MVSWDEAGHNSRPSRHGWDSAVAQRLRPILGLVRARLSPQSSMQRVSHVPELVRITHDIDGDDAAVGNLEGGGLENVTPLDGDEPRQAVDVTIAQEARPARGKAGRERPEQPHDVVEAADRRAM